MDRKTLYVIGGCLLLLVLLGGGYVVTVRGLRNNNPGNIRPLPRGEKWHGQIGVDSGNYVIFDTSQNGLRAMGRDFHTKITRDGLDTIAKIFPVYAPAGDNNDVPAYIAAVSADTGIDPDATLSADAGTLGAIVAAVIKHENGINPFLQSEIDSAMALV